MNGRKSDKSKDEFPSTYFQLFLLVEFISILIAIVTPFTPSKTGSKVNIAKYFVDDPTYLKQVLVNFIFVNVLILILGLIVVAAVYFDKKNKGN